LRLSKNLGTGTVEFNQGQDSATAENSSVQLTANATFNNQFKLNGQTTLVADKDTKSIFNAAIKDADYIEKDAADNDVIKQRKGSLVKTGEGEIVLNTENAYSGGTSIQQGTVTVAHHEALGTEKVSLENGTTLQSAANVTLANQVEVVSGNVTLSTPQVNQQNTSLTLSNTVSGDASITKTGVGTLTLNGTNTYTGQTIVKEGTLEINSAAALGTHTELSLNAGTTLTTTGQMTQKDDATDKTLSKNILLVGQADSQVTINTVGGDVVLSGKLQNDAVNNQAGIIKEGVSTLTLSGDNSSYQGKTTIKGGNIAISDAKNLGGKVNVELAGGGLTLLSDLSIGANVDDSISITGARGEINTATGTTSELGVSFKGTGFVC
jgi:fibronectin-binding autotransporter adhesin